MLQCYLHNSIVHTLPEDIERGRGCVTFWYDFSKEMLKSCKL